MQILHELRAEVHFKCTWAIHQHTPGSLKKRKGEKEKRKGTEQKITTEVRQLLKDGGFKSMQNKEVVYKEGDSRGCHCTSFKIYTQGLAFFTKHIQLSRNSKWHQIWGAMFIHSTALMAVYSHQTFRERLCIGPVPVHNDEQFDIVYKGIFTLAPGGGWFFN